MQDMHIFNAQKSHKMKKRIFSRDYLHKRHTHTHTRAHTERTGRRSLNLIFEFTAQNRSFSNQKLKHFKCNAHIYIWNGEVFQCFNHHINFNCYHRVANGERSSIIFLHLILLTFGIIKPLRSAGAQCVFEVNSKSMNFPHYTGTTTIERNVWTSNTNSLSFPQ